MKFAMNGGALTVGSMDSANIELRDAIGADNFFSFGPAASDVFALRKSGYDPRACCRSNEELRAVIDLIQHGFFSRGDPSMFRPLFDERQRHDPYFLLADSASYVQS